LNSSKLGRLHIASQLSGGIETSLGVLAEPEASLSSEADSVGVAVVDAASNEASDAALAVSVKLDAAGESCSDSSATVTDLCGDSKLGNNLAVGVDSSTKAWPEGEVTVLAEETVACGDGSNRSNIQLC